MYAIKVVNKEMKEVTEREKDSHSQSKTVWP